MPRLVATHHCVFMPDHLHVLLASPDPQVAPRVKEALDAGRYANEVWDGYYANKEYGVSEITFSPSGVSGCTNKPK